MAILKRGRGFWLREVALVGFVFSADSFGADRGETGTKAIEMGKAVARQLRS
jgi:hypothetical protein